MKGDKLVITEEHIRAARKIMKLFFPETTKPQCRFILTIAGESGSGKSEIAAALADSLSQRDMECIVLQQDDYFVYPPKTNENMRRKDIGHVGVGEVRLDLIDQNLEDIIEGKAAIEKPLVIFDEDEIAHEVVSLGGVNVVIVEGTYTTTLANAHQRVFIDRTYHDTKATRKRRAREKQDGFLEKVLEIEHEIISSHLPQATIIVTRDYDVMEAREYRRTAT